MTDSSFDGIDGDIVEAVLRVSRVLVGVATRSLERTDDEVTIPQFRALGVISSNRSCSLGSLASELGVTAPTASRMCDRLVAKKLVERTSDPVDRRQIRVDLTEQGVHLYEEVMEIRRAEITRILAAVPVGEREPIARSLSRFADASGEVMNKNNASEWGV